MLECSTEFGIFYQIDMLRMLYFSSIYSRMQYGIIIWGNAAEKYIQELTVRLNNLIRMITFSSKHCHMTISYKNLNLLKFGDVYKLELVKFMYQLHHNRVPKSLKLTYIHIKPDRHKMLFTSDLG